MGLSPPINRQHGSNARAAGTGFTLHHLPDPYRQTPMRGRLTKNMPIPPASTSAEMDTDVALHALLNTQLRACLPVENPAAASGTGSDGAAIGAGVFGQSAFGTLMVRGKDAAVFLHGLTTNHNQGLVAGVWQPNLLCSNKGGVLYPVQVLRLAPEQFLLCCDPQHLSAVAGHLQAYCIRDEVEIGQAPMLRVDLLGPKAEQVLAHLGIGMQSPLTRIHHAAGVVGLNPFGPVLRVSLLLDAQAMQPWIERLAQQGLALALSHEAFEELRVFVGMPKMGVDYQQGNLPQEASLLNHLSFRKGCYLGQEPHARLQHRGGVNRKLMAFCLAAQAEPGDIFCQGDSAIGSITKAPWQGKWRGIAQVRVKKWDETQPITLASQSTLDLSPLPWDAPASISPISPTSH